MTPCNPVTARAYCPLCLRHMPGLPHDAERRPHTVVMDASVLVVRQGSCPMFAAKPVPVQWHEPSRVRRWAMESRAVA